MFKLFDAPDVATEASVHRVTTVAAATVAEACLILYGERVDRVTSQEHELTCRYLQVC